MSNVLLLADCSWIFSPRNPASRKKTLVLSQIPRWISILRKIVQNEDESGYFSNFPNFTAKIRVHSGCGIICSKFFSSIITWNKSIHCNCQWSIGQWWWWWSYSSSQQPKPGTVWPWRSLSATTPMSPVNRAILESSSSTSRLQFCASNQLQLWGAQTGACNFCVILL